MTCPRCGAEVAESQEYCIECGLRQPGVSRLGSLPALATILALPLLVAALVAAGGAAAAIVLTRDTADRDDDRDGDRRQRPRPASPP